VTEQIDYAAIGQRQQQSWAAGDFSMVARMTVLPAETLVAAAGLRAGNTVLDIATGSGNVALAAARRFCTVTGIDFVPSLLERARERAAVEQLDATFVEGDAAALPVDDASFDVVLSQFGVMFAPDQQRAADEVVRICRPGGTIALASWTPDSQPAELFRINAKYIPPPAGLKPPVRWGTEEALHELFGDRVRWRRMERQISPQQFYSAVHYVEFFRKYLGPSVRAFASLDSGQQEALARDVMDCVERFNRSGDSTVLLENTYLESVGTRV